MDNGVNMASKELDFEELLKQYDYKFQKGDLVKGIVCGYDSQGVMVDIGAKTIAVVPTREAAEKDENVEDKLKKGEEYEFLIIREEDEDGKFLLSRKKVDQAYAWQELEKAKGTFTPSAFVSKITGVDNVCERSASLACDGGTFIMRKQAAEGVTAACTIKKWSVSFE